MKFLYPIIPDHNEVIEPVHLSYRTVWMRNCLHFKSHQLYSLSGECCREAVHRHARHKLHTDNLQPRGCNEKAATAETREKTARDTQQG